MFGIGTDRDIGQALELYGALVALGDRSASLAKGIYCEYGLGVEVDYNRAVGMYGFDIEPKRQLGRCFLLERGAERDQKLGVQLLWEAAKGGDGIAFRSLGACLEFG